MQSGRVCEITAGATALLVATVPLQGLLKTASVVTLFFPLVVLAVPILDTSFVVARRLKYRQPVYVADRTHLHHRFVSLGFTQRRAATVCLGIWNDGREDCL